MDLTFTPARSAPRLPVPQGSPLEVMRAVPLGARSRQSRGRDRDAGARVRLREARRATAALGVRRASPTLGIPAASRNVTPRAAPDDPSSQPRRHCRRRALGSSVRAAGRSGSSDHTPSSRSARTRHAVSRTRNPWDRSSRRIERGSSELLPPDVPARRGDGPRVRSAGPRRCGVVGCRDAGLLPLVPRARGHLLGRARVPHGHARGRDALAMAGPDDLSPLRTPSTDASSESVEVSSGMTGSSAFTPELAWRIDTRCARCSRARVATFRSLGPPWTPPVRTERRAGDRATTADSDAPPRRQARAWRAVSSLPGRTRSWPGPDSPAIAEGDLPHTPVQRVHEFFIHRELLITPTWLAAFPLEHPHFTRSTEDPRQAMPLF